MAFWQDDDDNGAYFSQSQSLLPFPSQSDTILSSSQLSSQPHRQSQSQQQQYSQNNSSSFLCQNCQGTDSYWDETTDRLVCADCHYESQQATQSSSQLDYEEVLQLAAKTKSGRIVRSGKTVSSSQPSSSQQPKRLAQPLEELDRSKPLPNLEKCLLGFQTVLYHGMEQLLKLLHWETGDDDDDENMENNETNIRDRDNASSSPSRRLLAHTLLKALWTDYLVGWKQGSESYARDHPHIRFSLRDAFVTHPIHRHLLDKALSHRALEQAKQELQAEREQKLQQQRVKQEDGEETTLSTLKNAEDDSDGSASSDGKGKKPAAARHMATRSSPRKRSRTVSSSVLPAAEEDDAVSVDSDSSASTTVTAHSSAKATKASSTTKAAKKTVNHKRKALEIDPDDDDNDDDGNASYNNDDDDDTEGPGKAANSGNRVAKAIYSRRSLKAKTHLDVAAHPSSRPSMTMAAAFLWLSVYRAGVTSSQICHWIQSGSLSLMNAFWLLDADPGLQDSLRPIQYFFQLHRPISIHALEHAATMLAVVGRFQLKYPELLQPRNNHKLDTKRLRFITPMNLPLVLRQMVVDFGLDQGVLDRCLRMVGLSDDEADGDGSVGSSSDGTTNNNETTTKATDAPSAFITNAHRISIDQVGRLPDVAALLAVSCFQDPNWRRWKYGRSSSSCDRSKHCRDRFVPWTRQQLHYLGNGPGLTAYADFLEQIILSESESYAPAFINMLGQESAPARVMPSSSNEAAAGPAATNVRPYPYMAGAPLCETGVPKKAASASIVNNIDVQSKMLIEFLAHSIGIDAVQVEAKVHKLLSIVE